MQIKIRTIPIFILLLGVWVLPAPAYSESPSIEQTLRFIEKMQLRGLSYRNEEAGFHWSYDEFRWYAGEDSLLIHKVKKKLRNTLEYSYVFKLNRIDRIVIETTKRLCANDNYDCRKIYPQLKLYCRENQKCINLQENRPNKKSSFSSSKLIAGSTIEKPDEKEFLYKLKNAFMHLATKHVLDIQFEDQYFVENLFSGSN